MYRSVARAVAAVSLFASLSSPLRAQQHQHGSLSSGGWQFMQEGVVFGVFNHQGGPRGVDEFKAPNWWMGMASKDVDASRLTLRAMVSLDPATAGKSGYAEIFQIGETLNGRPLVDRQHPHDFFMQLAAAWRMPLTTATSFTIGGGPAAEPALGPVAFMHRASAAEYPFATLSHHTFDSTHIAFGVITAAVDRGPWTVEGSVFNGREPDENRWNFDFAPLDSIAGRVWFRPGRWQFQASMGRLKDPEAFEPGTVQRTTASAAWLAESGSRSTALTIGYGVNATSHGRRNAVFGEATRRWGGTAAFGRVESLQVETALLLDQRVPASDEAAERKDVVGAMTLGGIRDVTAWRQLTGGLGAAITFYVVPAALRQTHGRHPVSFQLFFRLKYKESRD